MSRHSIAHIPAYRLHKPSGQAVVTLSGKDFYLGRWGSEASRLEHDRLILEWVANGRRLKPGGDLTISMLAEAYFNFAKTYYQKNGRPTGSIPGIKVALGFLRGGYGAKLASDFGPLALAALQTRMVQEGHSRRYVNDNIDRIRRAFKWAVAQELIPVSIYQALLTVQNLRKGRSSARETAPIGPVGEEVVEATLGKLSPIVADMVRIQRLTGCRPAEICLIRPCDIDRTGEVWSYRPQTHKTEHLGRERVIFLGPKAQAILIPYLHRNANLYCFSPRESEAARRLRQRANRKSPVQPSQVSRTKLKATRTPKECYTTCSYRRAIHRACASAFPAPAELSEDMRAQWWRNHQWHPNQLRHSAATEIRARFGLEAVQTVLGHSSANVSEIYAERDQRKAAEVMRQVG